MKIRFLDSKIMNSNSNIIIAIYTIISVRNSLKICRIYNDHGFLQSLSLNPKFDHNFQMNGSKNEKMIDLW